MRGGKLHRVARQIGQVRARRLPVGVRRIDARELQRCVTDVDLGVRQHADRFQRGTWVAHARQCGVPARSPLAAADRNGVPRRR